MWYRIHEQQVTLYILVKPNAAQSAFLGVVGDELHVRLKAKPIDGEANSALIALLAKSFKIPKKDIVLKRGDESRHKVLQLPLTPLLNTFLLEQSPPK
ncbi:MAG: DUF167 domain-containing protein [Pseudomonadota bacterium]